MPFPRKKQNMRGERGGEQERFREKNGGSASQTGWKKCPNSANFESNTKKGERGTKKESDKRGTRARLEQKGKNILQRWKTKWTQISEKVSIGVRKASRGHRKKKTTSKKKDRRTLETPVKESKPYRGSGLGGTAAEGKKGRG